MPIVRSLSQWIVYAVLSAFVADRFAALACAILAAILLAIAARSAKSTGEVVLELSSCAFFVIYAVLDWVVGGPVLPRWVGAASQIWLAATVLITLLAHRPFTLALAKREAPKEVWDTPEFYKFNVIITRVWLICFTVSAIILSVAAAMGLSSIWLSVFCIALAIAVPVIFTNRLLARQRSAMAAS
ncbi:hypothetical protein [Mariniluteicoccus flavus]